MPIHDWSRVDDGAFHDFHHAWTAEIRKALNAGLLPSGYYAQSEQVAGNTGPDVLTLQQPTPPDEGAVQPDEGGVATMAPPQTSLMFRAEISQYTARQRSVIIRHSRNHRIVALIEILSPGNKASEYAFQTLVTKVAAALYRGVHVLIVDLLAPTKRDPDGIHAAVWEAIHAGAVKPPKGRPLTLVSYDAGPTKVAYVEPMAVGMTMPSMPLFLGSQLYVKVPLEATYQSAWEGTPAFFREVLAGAGPSMT